MRGRPQRPVAGGGGLKPRGVAVLPPTRPQGRVGAGERDPPLEADARRWTEEPTGRPQTMACYVRGPPALARAAAAPRPRGPRRAVVARSDMANPDFETFVADDVYIAPEEPQAAPEPPKPPSPPPAAPPAAPAPEAASEQPPGAAPAAAPPAQPLPGVKARPRVTVKRVQAAHSQPPGAPTGSRGPASGGGPPPAMAAAAGAPPPAAPAPAAPPAYAPAAPPAAAAPPAYDPPAPQGGVTKVDLRSGKVVSATSRRPQPGQAGYATLNNGPVVRPQGGQAAPAHAEWQQPPGGEGGQWQQPPPQQWAPPLAQDQLQGPAAERVRQQLVGDVTPQKLLGQKQAMLEMMINPPPGRLPATARQVGPLREEVNVLELMVERGGGDPAAGAPQAPPAPAPGAVDHPQFSAVPAGGAPAPPGRQSPQDLARLEAEMATEKIRATASLEAQQAVYSQPVARLSPEEEAREIERMTAENEQLRAELGALLAQRAELDEQRRLAIAKKTRAMEEYLNPAAHTDQVWA